VKDQSRQEKDVRTLYEQLIRAWNQRDARSFAALYERDGHQVGFDGSQINGQAEIEKHLSQIF
jgi:uncharacterized protein (TIGR02246 family)